MKQLNTKWNLPFAFFAALRFSSEGKVLFMFLLAFQPPTKYNYISRYVLWDFPNLEVFLSSWPTRRIKQKANRKKNLNMWNVCSTFRLPTMLPVFKWKHSQLMVEYKFSLSQQHENWTSRDEKKGFSEVHLRKGMDKTEREMKKACKYVS